MIIVNFAFNPYNLVVCGCLLPCVMSSCLSLIVLSLWLALWMWLLETFTPWGLVVCGVRYPCLGSSMGTNFSNGLSHCLGDVLFRGQKIVCVPVCRRKAKSYPLGNVPLSPKICVLTPQKVPKFLFWFTYFCVLACGKMAKLLAAVVVRNCMLGVGQAAICQRLVQQYTYLTLSYNMTYWDGWMEIYT